MLLNKNFIFQNQKIAIQKQEKYFKVFLLVKHHQTWNLNFEMPLLVLEENEIVNAHQFKDSDDQKNYFKIILISEEKGSHHVQTEITTNKDLLPWLHIKTTFITKRDLKISLKGPDIQLILNPNISSLDMCVNINQPTKHTPPTDEWRSNDLPAGYVWNAQSKLETFIFFDFSKMDWMSQQTIERFSFYDIGVQSDGKFGLIQRILLKKPILLPTNSELVFDYYLSQNYRGKKPTKWDAVETLISKCFLLLPSRVSYPNSGLSWEKFCNGCIEDLMKEHHCWENIEFPRYHAYVQDSSELKRREAFDRNHSTFETMTLLDILPPWLIYLEIHEDVKLNQKKHVNSTFLGLKQFIDKNSNFLYNNITVDKKNKIEIIKPSDYSIGDSWYFFEPIVRFGWVIRLQSKSIDVTEYSIAFKVMCVKAIEFVKLHNYEISAFYDPYTFAPLDQVLGSENKRKKLLIDYRGEEDINWKMVAKNYTCLGIFIYLMTQAYYFFNNQDFLNYAIKSAKKFVQFSPDKLFWEPIEIAYGVAGFTELGDITGEDEYVKFANRLLLNELRMFYWYNDNSKYWKNKRNIQGLVQACVGIRYPAMKENVESVYPWLILLKTGQFSKEILKIFNLLRINSFYYFSNVLKSIGLKESIYPPRLDSPCEYIPFEDLELLETPAHFSKTQSDSPKGKRTGILGREIYGAGEVIWLYLMFEALAKTNNQDIMVLNLDLFDFKIIDTLIPKKLSFIVYNPFPHKNTCNVMFLYPKNEKQILTIMSPKFKIISNNIFSYEQLKKGVQITLNSSDYMYITLELVNA
jgi:hypothetical protein